MKALNSHVLPLIAAALLLFTVLAAGRGDCESDGWKKTAEQLMTGGNYREALGAIEEHTRENPKDHEGWQMEARCLIKMGKYDRALKCASKAMALHKGDFVSATLEGRIYLSKGSHDKAFASFTRALAINSEYTDARIGLGEIYLKKKQPDKGRGEMKKAMKSCVVPEAEVYGAIAGAYLREGLVNDAIYTYNEFLREEPENAMVHHLLAQAYLKKNDTRAEGALRKAVSFAPKNMEYREALGDYLAKAGNYKDAKKAYENAILLGKAAPTTYYRLGILYYHEKKTEKALPLLEKAVAGKPDLVNAHLALGAAYLRGGSYKKCLEHCNAIIKWSPDNETAYYNKACALAKLGKLAEAMQSLKKAIELEPSNKKLAKDEELLAPLRGLAEFRKLTE
ncbi:MAG: tetratricopeptide repeat protein [Candidatus Eremiobacteraeota bacterium]|nr:tetratricopeptide repeat protein [Candidatus Eremiobacteraeota bacterium]